jgi:hypothetical protein
VITVVPAATAGRSDSRQTCASALLPGAGRAEWGERAADLHVGERACSPRTPPYSPPRRRNLPHLTVAADGARLRPTQATWAESKTGHTLHDEHGPHSTSWTQKAHRKSMRRRATGTRAADRWAAGRFTPAPSRAYRTSVRTRVCLHRVAPRMTRSLTSSAFAHVIQRPGEHCRSRGGVALPCRHTGSARVLMRLVQRAPEHPSEADHRSPLFGRSSGSYPQ